MAYSNFDKIVNEALWDLIVAEFKIPVAFHNEYRASDFKGKNEYIRIFHAGSDLMDQGSWYETRSYLYEITYYLNFPEGRSLRKAYDNKISDRTNHLEYFLATKRDHQSDGYKWHGIKTDREPIGFGIPEIENTENIKWSLLNVTIVRTNETPEVPEAVDGGDLV